MVSFLSRSHHTLIVTAPPEGSGLSSSSRGLPSSGSGGTSAVATGQGIRSNVSGGGEGWRWLIWAQCASYEPHAGVVAPRAAPGAAAFSAVLVAAARRAAAAGPLRRQRPCDALRRAVGGLPRAYLRVVRARSSAAMRCCAARYSPFLSLLYGRLSLSTMSRHRQLL